VTKAAKTEFRRMKRKRFLRNGSIFERLRQANWKTDLVAKKVKNESDLFSSVLIIFMEYEKTY